MILFSEIQIDRFVDYRRRVFVGGIALVAIAIALPLGWGMGGFTGFMLFSLGAYSCAFRNWRTEPGLWMLAGLLTVIMTPCWAYFEYVHWRSIFHFPAAKNQVWNAFRLSTDALISLVVFEKIVRLSLTVAIQNWKRTRIAAGEKAYEVASKK